MKTLTVYMKLKSTLRLCKTFYQEDNMSVCDQIFNAQVIRQKMRNKKLRKLQQIIHFWNVQEYV